MADGRKGQRSIAERIEDLIDVARREERHAVKRQMALAAIRAGASPARLAEGLQVSRQAVGFMLAKAREEEAEREAARGGSHTREQAQ